MKWRQIFRLCFISCFRTGLLVVVEAALAQGGSLARTGMISSTFVDNDDLISSRLRNRYARLADLSPNLPSTAAVHSRATRGRKLSVLPCA